MPIENLPLSELDTTLADRCRCKRDPETIERYAGCIEALPPITVVRVGERLLVVDGAHRCAAAAEAGRTEIAGEVSDGTDAEAWDQAIAANQQHGLPLRAKDKRKILIQLLDDAKFRRWSDRRLAAKLGLSPTTVGDVRREREQIAAIPTTEQREAADGDAVTVPTPQAPDTIGDTSEDLLDDAPPATSPEYEAGAEAQRSGADVLNNPHTLGSWAAIHWAKGWHDAAGDRKPAAVSGDTAPADSTTPLPRPALPGTTSRVHQVALAQRRLIAIRLLEGPACTAPLPVLLALALRWGLSASTQVHDLCRRVLAGQGLSGSAHEELQHTFASAIAWSLAEALESPLHATSDFVDIDQIARWWGGDPDALRIQAEGLVP